MTDDEMDAFVAMGADLSVPEGGPVHVMTEQELSDDELLSGRPSEADLKGAQEALDKRAIQDFDPFEKQSPFEPEPSLGETVIEDLVTHPLSTAAGFSMVPFAGDVFASIRNLAEDTALDRYLPKVGSPSEFIWHMDENPGDWLHLIGANSKLQDMIANPEDYAE